MFYDSDEDSGDELPPPGNYLSNYLSRLAERNCTASASNREMASKARNAAYAEEKAEVEVLFAQADNHKNLGRRLLALRSRVEGEARTVREALGPVSSNTQVHQTVIHSMSISTSGRCQS